MRGGVLPPSGLSQFPRWPQRRRNGSGNLTNQWGDFNFADKKIEGFVLDKKIGFLFYCNIRDVFLETQKLDISFDDAFFVTFIHKDLNISFRIKKCLIVF